MGVELPVIKKQSFISLGQFFTLNLGEIIVN